MAASMPNAEVFICPEGSHLGNWDDQEAYFGALLGFLEANQ
jgi:pimeloyl-ACP methyl ester carboxylesterase